MSRRSIGVTLVAWLEIVVGLSLFLLCLAGVVGDLYGMQYEGFGLSLGILFLPVPVLSVVTGMLLLRLKPVARIMSIGTLSLLCFLALAMSMPALARPIGWSLNRDMVGIFFLGLLALASAYSSFFLTRSNVKAQFLMNDRND
jgi:hypothetical protein